MTQHTQLVIVENGGSNINSVRFALERLGVRAHLSDDPDTIRAASHVILPGVGAAGPGMATLREKELVDCIRGLSQPVLGVCLGMQLLFEHSEEGDTPCLGLFPGRVRHLQPGPGLSVPHMGWNPIEVCRDDNPLLKGLNGRHFYFVHSYAAEVNDACAATCDYGQPFCASAWRGNFFATQFHPEKSAEAGARLLENFIRL